SSRIVYLTLTPLCFVNSDGVSEAMSVICGFFTIATLMVFSWLRPRAAPGRAAAAVTSTAPAASARNVIRRRVVPARVLRIASPSSLGGGGPPGGGAGG